jgi:energy-coupling factor transporter ATP-binding protein EcfA2
MYLTRFGVKNYKCLGNIDIPLTPIHVLIGENDSGKTSLLEAINAFYAVTKNCDASAFKGSWKGCDLVSHRSSEKTISLNGEWHDLAGTDKNKSITTYASNITLGFSDSGKHINNMSSTQSSIPVNLTAFKISFDPKTMAVPAAFDPQRKFRLDPDGFGLSTLLDDILGFDFNIYSKLQDVFCNYFPQFRSIKLESENAIRRNYNASEILDSLNIGKGIYFETKNGNKVRAQQVSDGAILFLGFIAIAHLPDPPTLLLIEEPENGIYPKRLEEVMKLLRQLVEGNGGIKFPQIIMTTHSPYVLSYFKPEEVTFLSRPQNDPDGPVRARPLRDAPNIKERMGGEFYLGELWYNLSEEDLFGAP